ESPTCTSGFHGCFHAIFEQLGVHRHARVYDYIGCFLLPAQGSDSSAGVALLTRLATPNEVSPRPITFRCATSPSRLACRRAIMSLNNSSSWNALSAETCTLLLSQPISASPSA